MGRGAGDGPGLRGTPETVRAFVEREIEVGRVTYFVSGFAFGSLPVEAALRSAELFASEVMPALNP
jgi:alkanesulfonate monooxygenase SsuD/methylene tetrahydromethanopterin reductase-like flavin-dependent oxidoreductase (luciferase family)